MNTPYMSITDSGLKMIFPQETKYSKCEIEIRFHRTLRIPDDNKKYNLPPSLGLFPLNHVDDFAQNLPANWKEHGGVFLPMHQAEAMWVSFHSSWPFAVKLASGKINAVSGESWSNELKNTVNSNPSMRLGNHLEKNSTEQDYMVVPSQPWLDGFNVGKGVIRQFVAVPLDSGYTVEEQLTGSAEHGGLQFMVYPMKKSEWEKLENPPVSRSLRGAVLESMSIGGACASASASFSNSKMKSKSVDMGMGAGGFMTQEIYSDKYGFDKWDTTMGQRVFVHLLNSLQYKYVTGKDNPSKPLTPVEYKNYNYPWFDYYSEDKSLSGSDKLAKVDSIASLEIKNNENILGDNSSINKPSPHIIGTKTVKNGQW
jgi:hypothetical protein